MLDGEHVVVIAQFALYRHRAQAGFYAVVQGRCTAGLPTVVVAEDLPIGDRWEYRSSGLWAEQVHEAPTDTDAHWSYGLEAFAIRLDDPAELLGRGYGDRCALGWELDVFVPLDSGASHTGDTGCAKSGRGEGLLLYENLELDINGPATRSTWTLDSEHDMGSGLLRTEVGGLAKNETGRRPEGLPASVIIPTLLGEWVVAIADRPAFG